jgi:hypothetical protein
MILRFRDSKNDAKKGIWGHIDKLFAFAFPRTEFGENDEKKEVFRT